MGPRHRLIAALLLAAWALGACAAYQPPAPEVAVARLPPELMAASRKKVGNMLLTGVLTYQAFRPLVACGDEDCRRSVEKADESLQRIFAEFWDQLFTWPVAPANAGFDWADALKNLLELVFKLAKYVPARAGAAPPVPPGVPVPQFRAPATHLLPAPPMIETDAVLRILLEPGKEDRPSAAHEDGLPRATLVRQLPGGRLAAGQFSPAPRSDR